MSGTLGRVQAYVLVRALAGIGAALGVIASVITLIDLVEISRTVGSRVELNFFQLLELTVLKSPSVILELLPFVFLFGAMGAFAALNRRSELVAMRAAGASAWRFTLPTGVAAFLLGLVAISLLNPAAASLNGRFEDLRAQLTGAAGEAGEIWLRQGDDRDQIVIHARSHAVVGQTVLLQRVSLFIQSVGEDGQLGFARRIEAAQARLLPGAWRLTDVREAMPGSGSVFSEELSIPSNLDRRTALEKFAAPGAIAFWRLPATIRAAELAGYSPATYELRLHQLMATPLLYAAMTLLAAAFTFRLTRLGGLIALAVAGAGVGFAIFFLNQFCGALGQTEVIPAALAAWTTPILALLAGVTLLCYTEDG
ncbi:MAG: LptF/LptG family permease [Caulobacteraceae bacterium]